MISFRLNRVLTPYGTFSTPIPDIGPSFEVLSILEPHKSTIPIRCGELPVNSPDVEGIRLFDIHELVVYPYLGIICTVN